MLAQDERAGRENCMLVLVNSYPFPYDA